MANSKPNKTSFKKGVSGNPKGKPVGAVSITTAIKRKLNEIYNDPNDPDLTAKKKTHLELMVDTIMHNALKVKNARTLKDIWNYIDGLPKGNVGIEVEKESLQMLTQFFREASGQTKEDDNEES